MKHRTEGNHRINADRLLSDLEMAPPIMAMRKLMQPSKTELMSRKDFIDAALEKRDTFAVKKLNIATKIVRITRTFA